MNVSDDYKSSLRSKTLDSDRGSLRKIVELLARSRHNSHTADSVQTAATGTNYTPLTAGAAFEIDGDNVTGTGLTFRKVGTTVTFAYASGARVTLPCVANASEWEVKRTDNSNTQVTLPYLRKATV